MHISPRQFIRSILKFSVSSWLNFFIGIATVFATTRLFSPDVYGILNVFNMTSLALVSFSCVGLDTAFIRFYNEPPPGCDCKQLLGRCLLYTIIVWFILTISVFAFFVEDVSIWLFHQVSAFLVGLLCVNVFSLIVLNRFFAQFYRLGNDPYRYTIQQVLVQFFSKFFVVSAALFSPTIETVLTFNTIGLFGLLIVYYFVQGKKILPNKIKYHVSGMGEIYKFALGYWPINVIEKVGAFLIPILISWKLAPHEVGIYASAGFFVSAFCVLQNGFSLYWSAFMYAHYKDENDIIIKIHDYVVLGILFLLGVFIIFQHVAYSLIGVEFRESRVFFTLILLEPLLSTVSETTSYGIPISKKSYESTVIYCSSLVISLVMIFFLLPQFKLVGVAIGVAVSATIRFVFGTWRGQKYYKSIASKYTTFFGVSLIVLEAISNFVFCSEYLLEIFVVCLIWVIGGRLYWCRIKEICRFMQIKYGSLH